MPVKVSAHVLLICIIFIVSHENKEAGLWTKLANNELLTMTHTHTAIHIANTASDTRLKKHAIHSTQELCTGTVGWVKEKQCGLQDLKKYISSIKSTRTEARGLAFQEAQARTEHYNED